MRRTDPARSGFSLVEVATALAIISFALVGLIGVFPLGLENGRVSVAETRAAQLTKMVFSTLATEASVVTASPPSNVIHCFSTKLDPLDLPADGFVCDESATLPDVAAKLYASYDALGQPEISRDATAAAAAIYQLDLVFRPRTFSYVVPPTATGESAKAKKRVMGYDVRLRIAGLNKTKTIFETSNFVPSFQRAAYAK